MQDMQEMLQKSALSMNLSLCNSRLAVRSADAVNTCRLLSNRRKLGR